MNHLPDLIVGHIGKSHHAGALGAVFDDPEHLAVGYILHGFPTREVPWRRIQGGPHRPLSVTFGPMAIEARQRLSRLLVQRFAGLDVDRSCR